MITWGKFVLCDDDPGTGFVGGCRGHDLAIRLNADIGVWRCLSREYGCALRVDPNHIERRKRFVGFLRLDGRRLGRPHPWWLMDLCRLLETRRAGPQDNVNEIRADHDRA